MQSILVDVPGDDPVAKDAYNYNPFHLLEPVFHNIDETIDKGANDDIHNDSQKSCDCHKIA
jgi:hypothetical protein